MKRLKAFRKVCSKEQLTEGDRVGAKEAQDRRSYTNPPCSTLHAVSRRGPGAACCLTCPAVAGTLPLHRLGA